jgi:uncharacterized membrane protein YgaE (UPF0421/DUF939 family)
MRPIAQMAIAAGLAWQVATAVLGHPYPFFAAIAAVVCLGFGSAYRVRRVAELAIGVTLGVALGEVLVEVIGRGAWQVALIIAVGLVIARFLDSGVLLANQIAIQAVLVVAIPQAASGSVARWLDALVGGLVALAVAVLTPPDPRRSADSAARAATDAVADALAATSASIRARDAEGAAGALAAARDAQPLFDAWEEAVVEGEQIARLSPLRRRHIQAMAERRRALTGMERAYRNVRVLARRVASSLDDGRRVPLGIADLADDLVGALARLEAPIGSRRHPTFVAAVATLARRLDVHDAGGAGWSATTSVAQLRSIVVDILTATGMSARRARSLLPDPGTGPLTAVRGPSPPAPPAGSAAG